MIPAIIKSRLILIATLIIFIILKMPHLHCAYYWDESIPYAVAIKDLYNHGISLMPNAIDAEISRGHPLFFHAIAAGWMHIFGDSHESMHSFALLISGLLLIAVYEAGLRLFNIRVATMALLLLATHEMFFVQSSMVLFEVLVALLSFLSLVFYIHRRFILSALFLTMLFYTKESGMVMGFVLGIDALVHLFNKTATWKDRLSRIAAVGVPTLLIALYFLIQKYVQGWFVFPFYASLVPREWKQIWYAFRMNAIRAVFYDNLKYYQFLLLTVLAIAATIKQRNFRLLALLPPTVCIYYFVDDMRAGRPLPSIPFFLVFLLSTGYFVYEYSNTRLFPALYQRRLIILGSAFIFCFLCFSSLNYFTPRYMLACVVPLFFITAVIADKLIDLAWSRIYYLILPAMLAINAIAIRLNKGYGDADLGAFDGIAVHEGVADYFEKNVPTNSHISSFLFLERTHLTIPASGFLHSGKAFMNVSPDVNDSTQYFIADNIETDHTDTDLLKRNHFELIHKITRGKVWAEIYKRKQNR